MIQKDMIEVFFLPTNTECEKAALQKGSSF